MQMQPTSPSSSLLPRLVLVARLLWRCRVSPGAMLDRVLADLVALEAEERRLDEAHHAAFPACLQDD